MAEHTPTPWVADPDDRPGMEWNVHIVEAARPHMRVCFMANGPNAERDAAFIVKATTSFDALVKALQKIRSYNVDIVDGRINYRPMDHIQVIDAALTTLVGGVDRG